jgi:hypothetical protein
MFISVSPRDLVQPSYCGDIFFTSANSENTNARTAVFVNHFNTSSNSVEDDNNYNFTTTKFRTERYAIARTDELANSPTSRKTSSSASCAIRSNRLSAHRSGWMDGGDIIFSTRDKSAHIASL